jgi:hypothetical protein
MSAKNAERFVVLGKDRNPLSVIRKNASAACGDARLAADAPISVNGQSGHNDPP